MPYEEVYFQRMEEEISKEFKKLKADKKN